jgi:hypothetical protein
MHPTYRPTGYTRHMGSYRSADRSTPHVFPPLYATNAYVLKRGLASADWP